MAPPKEEELNGAVTTNTVVEGSSTSKVPVVDLSWPDDSPLIELIAQACRSPGFFQIVNHGISQDLIAEFRQQMKLYFELPYDVKLQWKRKACNARGYFDDELTKQKRDWKECLDVGVPGSRDWTIPDDDPSNGCLDGFNPFPPVDILPDYRRVTIEYFQACTELSHRITKLMACGISKDEAKNVAFLTEFYESHTSYLRTNYYPLRPNDITNTLPDSSPLGISPHRDAGFLTVLLQDDDCHSLQVQQSDGSWELVHPIPGSLTINTGDMAQLWSNGEYQAPLHRVLTNDTKPRYSAPFFYNPGYKTWILPINQGNPIYSPCLWGYFRAVRFAGDLTDLGVEIQAEDFLFTGNESPHLKRQQLFLDQDMTNRPFDVEEYRKIIQQEEREENN